MPRPRSAHGKCARCGLAEPVVSFTPTQRSTCRSCRKIYDKNYRANMTDAERAYDNERRRLNKIKLKEQAKANGQQVELPKAGA